MDWNEIAQLDAEQLEETLGTTYRFIGWLGTILIFIFLIILLLWVSIWTLLLREGWRRSTKPRPKRTNFHWFARVIYSVPVLMYVF